MVLFGPRGNGRTVLLKGVVRRAERHKIRQIDIGLGEAESLDGQFAESRGLSRRLSMWISASPCRRVRSAAVGGEDGPISIKPPGRDP